ncbi:BolA family protein [Fastidiosibacter lacustris]|uniref:BolA family protein n=1 Tax=Fastidiosibacter lacustris TaxID=2056695 RepID=UPI000E3458A8|nr:BolA/IbaG family iron-sulfur metabolism protein [Fastidiosibacter lacustris]
MTTNELKTCIEQKLGHNTIAIVESDDNVHFSATIISELFNTVLSKVKQQQIVYTAIDQYIKSGELHAIAMKTYTPEKWAQAQNT